MANSSVGNLPAQATPLVGGDLVPISRDGIILNKTTLNNIKAFTDNNSFSTISVSGQPNVVADSITDTLTIVAGKKTQITTNATTDTITFNTIDNYAETTGTGSAYVATPQIPITSYVDGDVFLIKFTVASAINASLQISGINPPINLKVQASSDGSYQNVGAGDIPAGHLSQVIITGSGTAGVVMPGVSLENYTTITSNTNFDISNSIDRLLISNGTSLTHSLPLVSAVPTRSSFSIYSESDNLTIQRQATDTIRFNTDVVNSISMNKGDLIEFINTGTTWLAISTVNTATLTDVSNRTDGVKAVSPLSLQNLLVNGTAIATTSGNTHEFTGIPSWVKRLKLSMSGLTTNGVGVIVVQIGPVGGVETTAYDQTVARGGTATAATTNGFALTDVTVTSAPYRGYIELVKLSGNTWVQTGTVSEKTTPRVFTFSGEKTLAGALSRIRITTPDTFNGGLINIQFD